MMRTVLQVTEAANAKDKGSDLRSSNGTSLNGDLLHPYNKRRLQKDDNIGLGSAKLVVVQLVDASTIEPSNKRLTLSTSTLFGEKKKKGKAGPSYKVDEMGATIGRSAQNTIQFGFNNVSSQHCMISLQDDNYVVSDLGSSNGTFVNGTRLEKNVPRILMDGEVLRLAITNPSELLVRIEEKKAKPEGSKKISKQVLLAYDLEKEMSRLTFVELRDNLTFESILAEEVGIEYFHKFLCKCFNEENILFWKEVQKYKELTTVAERRKVAEAMYNHYVKIDSEMELNVDTSQRDRVKDGLQVAEPTLFSELEEIVCQLMRFDSMPKFLQSPIGQEYYVKERKMKGRQAVAKPVG